MAKQVIVRYFNIIRDRAGKKEDRVILRDDSGRDDILGWLRENHGEEFRKFVFTEDGQLKPHLRLVRKGNGGGAGVDEEIKDGDEFYLFVAIAGGTIGGAGH